MLSGATQPPVLKAPWVLTEVPALPRGLLLWDSSESCWTHLEGYGVVQEVGTPTAVTGTSARMSGLNRGRKFTEGARKVAGEVDSQVEDQGGTQNLAAAPPSPPLPAPNHPPRAVRAAASPEEASGPDLVRSHQPAALSEAEGGTARPSPPPRDAFPLLST